MTQIFQLTTLSAVVWRALLVGTMVVGSFRSQGADGLAGLVETAERMDGANPAADTPEACSAAATAFPSVAPVKADTRRPVPDEAEVRRARLAVAAIFEDRASKARTPAEWTAVAREMFGLLASIQDPTERYAIQIAALDVASRGNDVVLLFEVADGLANNYQVERTALIPSRLERLAGPVAPEAWSAASSRLRDLVEACVVESRYDEAGDVITAYAAIGKRAKDPMAASAAAVLRKSVVERRKAADKLLELLEAAKAPNTDPKVFMEVGRIMCFVKGDWSNGLPYLARSSDVAMAKCASMDIAAKVPDEKLAAADAWARLADDAPPADREPYYDRASSIYSQILPSLSGLAKVRAEKAMDAIATAATSRRSDGSAWTVVFRSADPSKWNTDSQRDPRNFALAVASFPETIRFVRLRRLNGAAVIMPVTKSELATESTGERYGWQGARRDYWGAAPLGIFDMKENVFGRDGKVAVYHSGERSYTGWGFGHRIVAKKQGEPAQLCWAGTLIPIEPLEIAVTSRPLTATDLGFLLK
jgi:hypothetical protein